MVDQSAAQIEHFVLSSDGKWQLTELAGLDKTLTLDGIDCRVPFTEVYRKVTLPIDGQTDDNKTLNELETK